MKQRRRCAFTLVEILVVLAIITLLAALLFPVFGRVRENGRAATCLSNQKQVLLALQLYQEDAAGHFPSNNDIGLSPQIWIDELQIYAKSAPVFVCPSDAEIESKRDHGFTQIDDKPTKYPAIPSSYIANGTLMSVYENENEDAPTRSMAETEIVKPASTVFLCDGAKEASQLAPYWREEMGDDDVTLDLAQFGYILRDPSAAMDGPDNANGFAPNPRHNGRAIVGFVDGHVKSMDLSQWYFPHTPYLDPARGG